VVRHIMTSFERDRKVQLSPRLLDKLQEVFLSTTVSDENTLDTMKSAYEEYKYTLCPHSATAVYALKLPEVRRISLKPAPRPQAFPSNVSNASDVDVKQTQHGDFKSEHDSSGTAAMDSHRGPVIAVLTAHPAKFEETLIAAGIPGVTTPLVEHMKLLPRDKFRYDQGY